MKKNYFKDKNHQKKALLSESSSVQSNKSEDITRRYSDAYDDKRKQQGWWYFTTHGVQSGSIPKGLDVLEIKDGKNNKGTTGTFVRLNGILNTDELNKYEMKEMSPIDESISYISESIEETKEEMKKWIDFGDDEVFEKAAALFDSGIITKPQLIWSLSNRDIEALYSRHFDKNGKELKRNRHKSKKLQSMKESFPTHGSKIDLEKVIFELWDRGNELGEDFIEIFDPNEVVTLTNGEEACSGIECSGPTDKTIKLSLQTFGYVIKYKIRGEGDDWKVANSVDELWNIIYNRVGNGIEESLIESAGSKKISKEIFDFIEGLGGYSDYDGKIEAVMDEFDLSKKDAERYVWNWSIQVESLTEDRSLAKPFKRELKNAYKSFDASRDSVRKKNAAVVKTWNQVADGIPMDDNAKNILLKPEPKFSQFKPDRSNSLEREEYPFYVTYYEETPYYHPEEGGYYVAGRQAIMSKGFDNKDDALRFAKDAADHFGFEKIDDTWYHLGSRYIGEDDSVRVETKREYLSDEAGDSVYESLTEDYNYDIEAEVRSLVDDIHEFEGNMSRCYVTWNFGEDKEGNLTGGVDLRMNPKFSEDKEECDKANNDLLDIFKRNGFELDTRLKYPIGRGLFGSYHYQIIKK